MRPLSPPAHNHDVMASAGGGPSEYFAVAHLMANPIVFAFNAGGGAVSAARSERSTGHPAAMGPATTYLMKSLRFVLMLRFTLHRRFQRGGNSRLPSARARRRYQTTIAISENRKMMVEMALISGVMPRRRRPQISSGRVLSRPIRKKLTAISSMDRVKISNAAPMMDNRRLGRVTCQKVCQVIGAQVERSLFLGAVELLQAGKYFGGGDRNQRRAMAEDNRQQTQFQVGLRGTASAAKGR